MKLVDVASERGAIAAVYQGGYNVFAEVAEWVSSRSFGLDSNANLWACIDHIYKENTDAQLDYPSIISAANSIGLGKFFEKPEEHNHLRSIMNLPVRPENGRKFAGKVKKLEIARLMDSQLDLVKKELGEVTGDESIDQIIGRVQEPIFDFTSLLNDSDGGWKRAGDGAEEYFEYLLENPREMCGLTTGFPRHDRAIGGGIRPNSMDVIAARPGSGKTMRVMNTAIHIASVHKVPVLHVDTEMTWEEQMPRMGARLTGMTIDDIETGKAGRVVMGKEKLREAAKQLRDMPFTHMSVIGWEPEDIISKIRHWIIKEVGLNKETGKANPCVVIYDYLKMMSMETLTKSSLNEYQVIGFLASALKNLAGKYAVGIPTYVQLNREHDVSQSDRILWFCTSLAHMVQKSDEELAENPTMAKYRVKMMLKKSRYGRGLRPDEYINIKTNFSIGEMSEGPSSMETEERSQNKGEVVEGQADGPVDF